MTGQPKHGKTDSECYLTQLCKRTFLSLWSYPNLHYQVGQPGNTQKKELVDVLALFRNNILLFSDKECVYEQTVNPQQAWARYYKKAIFESAGALFRAERILRRAGALIYTDTKCVEPFPLAIPAPSNARFHRICVCRGAARHFGPRGEPWSYIIDTSIQGDQHLDSPPFSVGHVSPERGFVHIFDELGLEYVLQTFDTVSDLISYLSERERLLGARLVLAAGEEELVGYYKGHLNADGNHGFESLHTSNAICVQTGHWSAYAQSEQRRFELEANRDSYVWDKVIERFIQGGEFARQDGTPCTGLATKDECLGFMAAASRFHRRILAAAFLELLRRTEPGCIRDACVVPKLSDDGVYWVFMVLEAPSQRPYEEYVNVRKHMLECYCKAVRVRFEDALHIVGVATEPGYSAGRSENLVYVDGRNWSKKMIRSAKRSAKRLNILTNPTFRNVSPREYG